MSSTRLQFIQSIREQIGDENTYHSNGPDDYVWKDQIYRNVLTDAIKAHSRFRPFLTTGDLTISADVRLFDPPTGVDLRAGHRIQEIRYINDSTRENYRVTGWSLDVHQNKVDFGYYQVESKTYTCYISMPYSDFSSDTATIDIPENDEDLLLQWCRCQFWKKMSKTDFDSYGKLEPTEYTTGHTSEKYGDVRKAFAQLYVDEYADWKTQIAQHGTIYSHPKKSINEVWVPPRDFL